MEHHADFAVAVTQRLWMRTAVPRRNGQGQIAGWVIALGWWAGEPASTLYLIVDEGDPGAPVWVAQGNVLETRLQAPA